MPKIWDEKKKTTARTIHIEPVTRLEGHAKIDIFLDADGNVEDTYFQVVELRGFEEFCKGRPAEEIPRIVTRLCGVCPWPHHLASTLALDQVFAAPPPRAAHKIRELGYCAHMLESHLEHIYALGMAPDFVVGPAADQLKRNVFGVIAELGLDIGTKVIKHRSYAVEIEDIIGGKSTHPVFSLPGGVSHPVTREERKRIQELAGKLVDFCEFTIAAADKIVMANPEYVAIILNKDLYYHRSYHMGMVDADGRFTFYGGRLKIMDPDGKYVADFEGKDYLAYIAEHPVPWSYLKFPYLRQVGWKGLVDGKASGMYRVAPLARLNVCNGMATPKAQQAYKHFMKRFGPKPVQHSLTYHLARAVEALYAAERLQELAADDEILSRNYRTISKQVVGEGVGVVEAPRGTLFHHYKTDANGMMTDLNLLVASAQNYGAMNMDVRNVAKTLIKNGMVSDGIFNMVEMAFRAYDPCFSCATHAAIGQMPMQIVLRDNTGAEIRHITRS
ncbi:MAG: Ni/Fe hydrogenase subunit alpha [Kiritimatiellaeota bacterium]|nr:Ni/Fe hydrogenase subunit alpha [Kiritimatiellota bacterium]